VNAEQRQDFLDLMREVWGTSISPAEYDWRFGGGPAGAGLVSVARDDGRVVGVLGMTFVRMRLGGEVQTVPWAVQGATSAAARGRGVFSGLELDHERTVASRGHQAVVAFANPDSARIFVNRVGWRELFRVRIWARPKRLRRTGRGGLTGGRAPRFSDRHAAWDGVRGNRIVKDEAYLRWRYEESPREYRLLEGAQGFAVVGHAVHKGFSAGLVCELAGSGRPRLLRECARAVDADIVIAFVNRGEERHYLAAGFVPTPESIRFIAKPLTAGVELPPRRDAWRFTLGDLDFF